MGGSGGLQGTNTVLRVATTVGGAVTEILPVEHIPSNTGPIPG